MDAKKEAKMNLLPLAVRIPMGLTIAVTLVGIVVFLRISGQGGPFPTTYFAAWLAVVVLLSGITVWSWRRNKG
jgi:hypothetical protein